MSIVCPNCHHEELDGAFFCSECATKLVSGDGLSTATIKRSDANVMNAESNPPAPTGSPVANSLINLHIMRSGQILPMVGQDSFSVGRVSEGQSILPDIDLTPFEAYSQGVSRLHATIQINKNDIFITDLGSSNGTWVNKNKLSPHENVPISHGDILVLGKLKIQALIRKP